MLKFSPVCVAPRVFECVDDIHQVVRSFLPRLEGPVLDAQPLVERLLRSNPDEDVSKLLRLIQRDQVIALNSNEAFEKAVTYDIVVHDCETYPVSDRNYQYTLRTVTFTPSNKLVSTTCPVLRFSLNWKTRRPAMPELFVPVPKDILPMERSAG